MDLGSKEPFERWDGQNNLAPFVGRVAGPARDDAAAGEPGAASVAAVAAAPLVSEQLGARERRVTLSRLIMMSKCELIMPACRAAPGRADL